MLSFLHSPNLTSIHDYWKNHTLTRQTYISKVMSLLFNILSRLIIAFLPRSEHLLISCLQSPSAVILQPRKIKPAIVSTLSPSICHDMMELTHWKRPWCWERLKAGGEVGSRGWDGLMASHTQWTWVWASSGSWWWTGIPACCSPWGCKESDITVQLNLTDGTRCHDLCFLNAKF